MDSDGTADGYTIGENVTQIFTSGTILTGEVAAWSDSDNILHLVNFGADDGAFHLPVTGRQVVGALSNNIATPSAVTEELKQNENEQNSVFETTSDVMSFLDFSETNPFGDVQ
jgi:predicted transcriptional regulator